jgi:hypothetical protein
MFTLIMHLHDQEFSRSATLVAVDRRQVQSDLLLFRVVEVSSAPLGGGGGWERICPVRFSGEGGSRCEGAETVESSPSLSALVPGGGQVGSPPPPSLPRGRVHGGKTVCCASPELVWRKTACCDLWARRLSASWGGQLRLGIRRSSGPPLGQGGGVSLDFSVAWALDPPCRSGSALRGSAVAPLRGSAVALQ